MLHLSPAAGPISVRKMKQLPATLGRMSMQMQPRPDWIQERLRTSLRTESTSSTTPKSEMPWRISIRGTGRWIN